MLYLVATPIGNLEDVTLRALRILKEVDYILAEDTRRSAVLLKHYQINTKLVSFFEANEEKKTAAVIADLKQGKNIALVSEAGTPTISDPGYKLVRACRQEKIEVVSIPGPSSIIAALSVSSIPREKFIFLGFLPKKQGARKTLFNEIKQWGCAVVFFESPYRIEKTFMDIKESLGNLKVTIAREMTKKFEETSEMTVEQALAEFKVRSPKGEYVIILNQKTS